MSQIGWVKLHRKFLEWEWFTVNGMVVLFIYLLLNAKRKDEKFEGINIKRGQLITGRKILSKNTGLSEQTIRTCLTRLNLTNEITIETTNKYSIITICKYDDYQTKEEDDNQQNNQDANQQLTSNQPATNQQLTTIYKKETNKEEKKKDISSIEIDDKNLFDGNEESKLTIENRRLEKIKNVYNKTNLPKIREITDQRKKYINARIDQHGFDVVLEVLQKVENSNFLCGENEKGWCANFDWIFNTNNFVKIMEGQYDNRKGTSKGGNSMGTEVLKGKKIENEFSRTAEI